MGQGNLKLHSIQNMASAWDQGYRRGSRAMGKSSHPNVKPAPCLFKHTMVSETGKMAIKDLPPSDILQDYFLVDSLSVSQHEVVRKLREANKMGVTAVFILPLLLLGISGLLFVYQEVSRLWSKSAVQNKVVVLTDAISGLGKAVRGNKNVTGPERTVQALRGPQHSLNPLEPDQARQIRTSKCARVFHAGGARLVLCGKNWERLETLYDALISVADPSKTFTPKLVLLDLSDVSCVPDVAKEILDCYGCVDILINNASMKVKGPAHKISLELDKKIMDANYFGPITLTKGLALLPDMITRRTGQIVLVNNIQGKLGIPFRTAYAASKHAALGFFDCLRAEVEEYDVVVSTLTYGVHPVDVAEEVMRTVRRKKQEVFMANPIPKAAMYIRTFFPEFFFAVVACGVKEKLNVPEES
ncbi:dehydrogenase/reductase SDR family member 7B isoform X3 [Prionailurus iriomotensis]